MFVLFLIFEVLRSGSIYLRCLPNRLLKLFYVWLCSWKIFDLLMPFALKSVEERKEKRKSEFLKYLSIKRLASWTKRRFREDASYFNVFKNTLQFQRYAGLYSTKLSFGQ